ncbi:DUF1801 domain-containing protein [uncultured Draconibacterium sp.]|uniref:iron chaperone n=1 Tax=uncultured Draconibacterium sp. TaxID=1573823 RepID=UPI0032175D3E
MDKNINNVDEYIAGFPEEIQTRLKLIRQTIKEHAPEAVESILYGMPAYKTFKKPLVYFAAFAKHIGFYATPTGHDKFEEELAKYKRGKGSVQFPHNKELPINLIEEMVQFRVNENKENAAK